MKDDERWTRVSEILAHALDLPEPEQAKFLTDACRDQPALRTEVFALFQDMRGADEFLEEPPEAPQHLLTDSPDGAFGPYRIVRALGEGGMGVVYLAERSDGQFTRQVAVKRIGSVTPGPDLLRRFRDEREILARLDHPNIARLLDAGFDSLAVPYLVMEYVDGEPLTVWCRNRQVSVGNRLDLFLKICDAVQHAHQNLVIHRDIKPGNILVTSAAEPKLLDFGIAKIFGGDAPADVTRTVNRALSLDYASPEQVRGETVTTASDVYSLGVVLYELLADARPHDAGQKSLTEAVRTICEETAAPPSFVAPAERRAQLRGDLDAVVAKAMEKAPGDRYASVAELSGDVRAHMDHLPVKARKLSFGYGVRTFARRHRAGTAVAAGIMALLVAGLSAVAWQYRIAQRERLRAENRFQDVRELANFVIYDLQDGISKLAGSTELRKTMVERSIRYLDSLAGEASGDRGLQLELAGAYVRLGSVLGRSAAANLGDRIGAISSFQKARALLLRVLDEGGEDRDVRRQLARVLITLHSTYDYQDAHRDVAATTLMEAMQIWEGLVREEPASEDNLRGLASVHFSAAMQNLTFTESVAHLEKALDLFERLLTASPHDLDRKRNVALCHKNLSGQFGGRDPTRSLHHARRAAQLDAERLAAAPHDSQAKLDFSIDLSTLGDHYFSVQMYAEALRYFQQALPLRQALAEADRLNVYAVSRLAYMLVRTGETLLVLKQPSRALPLLRDSATRIEGIPEDRRDVSGAATLLRAYAALGEAQLSLKQEHCAFDRRAARVLRTTPATHLRLGDGPEGMAERVERALARAKACGG